MTPMPTHISGWLEQAWLARYLDRQLTGEEAAWFEAYVLDKPELLDVIDADTRLRDALAADRPVLASNDVTVASSADLSASSSSASISSFRRKPESSSSAFGKKPRPPWLALAASLLLGLGVGSIGMRALAPNHGADIVASPTRIVYDTMRGEATPPRIEHADSQSPYVLVEVAVPPGAENITLHIDGMPDQALTPSPDGFVNFLVPRKDFDTSKKTYLRYKNTGVENTHSISFPILR